MNNSTFTETAVKENFGRQFVILVVIGILFLGSIAGGGIVAAQQVGSNATNTTNGTVTIPKVPGNGSNGSVSNPVNAIIQQFKRENLGYKNLSASKQKKFKKKLQALNDTEVRHPRIMTRKQQRLLGDLADIFPKDGQQARRDWVVKHTFGIGADMRGRGRDGGGWGGGGDANGTQAHPVNATIQDFKRENLGYTTLSASKKQKFKKKLQALNDTEVRKPRILTREQQRLLDDLADIFPKDGKQERRTTLTKQNFGIGTKMRGPGLHPKSPDLNINIPNVVDQKMRAMGDAFKKGATESLGTVYGLAFTTPVPENDGWHGVFGQPVKNPSGDPTLNATGNNSTNATGGGGFAELLGISPDKTYHALYHQLLIGKLYPVLNRVLGIGVIVLGLSLTVKPLMSRFRALDLMTKFVSFLFLYVFSWGAITLMHGIVNDIVMWLQPTQAEFQALVTNLDKIGAGAAAAYLAGAGGIFSTVFGMGLELAIRQFALLFFFPYVFPVLLLLLYISPWSRLSRYASMGIWQYVNVLTMVIPMAALLKAAVIVPFSVTKGIGGMIVLIALFGFAAVIPAIQTYFFIQVPGKAGRAVKSAAAGAATRVGGAAKNKIWGDGESSSDSTATGDTSPGDRTEDAVEASVEESSGVPSSGELSAESIDKMDPTETSETTAGKVRDLDADRDRDPMNPTAMKESYFEDGIEDHPRRTTMRHKLADTS